MDESGRRNVHYQDVGKTTFLGAWREPVNETPVRPGNAIGNKEKENRTNGDSELEESEHKYEEEEESWDCVGEDCARHAHRSYAEVTTEETEWLCEFCEDRWALGKDVCFDIHENHRSKATPKLV